jgi:putative addiction module component (TIGR02574 family)
MTDRARRLKEELLGLPEEDRVELAHFLWDSLEGEAGDEMEEGAFIAELERRSVDAEAGRTTEEPFRKAIEELRGEKP